MKRDEIEQTFRDMALVHNRAHDFWHFPPGINSSYQFTIRDLMNMGTGGASEKELQIRVNGGPVATEGWYMPDQGIKKIQLIIKDMFENTFRHLYGSYSKVWNWDAQFQAYKIATNSKLGKLYEQERNSQST